MDKIAVLIPCYNEAQTIGKVVKDFREVLPDAVVYVYDNNSTDDTAHIALEAGAVVRYEPRQGKGNVIRRMFREVDARCYIMADGDDTYPTEYAGEMTEAVLDRQADMVVGDRLSSTYFKENKRRFHNIGNAFVRRAINYLFDTDIKDILTGYRAFSYKFVKSFHVMSTGFEIETEMSIHAADKRLKVENIVVDYRNRPEGSESKLSTFSDGWRVIKMIIRLFRLYRPMNFFGLISAVLILLGIIFMIPVMNDYFHTGLVERFPTLIVCGFAILSGITSFFTGQVLDTMAWKNRQDFERELIWTADRYRELTKDDI
ncbi:MAG: glycosyltransferase [Lachnospiraceae bacterium]|nr:glycosyltransferase [Lachnospiraceae bacterium]